MNKLRVTISLALPLIILLSTIAKSEYQIRSGETWAFKIGAYDPRDILKGQYLRFKVLWDWEKKGNAQALKSNFCTCLKRKQETIKISKARCDSTPKTCDGFIRNKYLSRIERYYIPEKKGKELEKQLRDKQAEIVLSINSNGYPVIKDLLIEGQSLKKTLY
jgi:uncharacterized membrane-anchored protein